MKDLTKIRTVQLSVTYGGVPTVQRMYAIGGYQFNFYPAIGDCPTSLYLRHGMKEYLGLFSEDKKLAEFRECRTKSFDKKTIPDEKRDALLSEFKDCLERHDDTAVQPSIIAMKNEMLEHLEATLDLSEARADVRSLVL